MLTVGTAGSANPAHKSRPFRDSGRNWYLYQGQNLLSTKSVSTIDATFS